VTGGGVPVVLRLPWQELPAVEDGNAGAPIAERDPEVDRVVGHLDAGAFPPCDHVLAVGEVDLLRRWVEAPRGTRGEGDAREGAVGDGGRVVRGAYGGERRAGEDERSARGRQRRDGRPVGHGRSLCPVPLALARDGRRRDLLQRREGVEQANRGFGPGLVALLE